jgi:hypothetical protein
VRVNFLNLRFAFCLALLAPAALWADERAAVSAASNPRDPQHDFDFNLGRWKVHIAALHQPANGAGRWNTFDGTAVVRKVWDGRSQLEEIQADGAAGHLEALVLFLYNAQSHQWSKAFAASGDGQLGQPMFGEFKDGRGEFYDQELFHGRIALLRAVWSNITPSSQDFEEASSDNGGRTWQPYFVAKFVREGQ